jgi:hypothetical protein
MAIFNSYVKLPEGILNRKIMDNDDSAVEKRAIHGYDISGHTHPETSSKRTAKDR